MVKKKWFSAIIFIFFFMCSMYWWNNINVRASQVSEQETSSDKIMNMNREYEITRYFVKDGKTVKYEETYAAEDAYTSKIETRKAEKEPFSSHEETINSGMDMETGQCGENLFWNLSKDGIMTISGEGAMWDYQNEPDCDYHPCPWENYKKQIKSVVFEPGITSIGVNAFESCTSLKKVTFSDTITSIGRNAFWQCGNLENFMLPENLKYIGGEAFAYCTTLTSIVIPDTVTFLDACICRGDSSLVYAYIGGNKEAGAYIFSNAPFLSCEKLEYIHVSPDNIALTEKDGVLYSKDMTIFVEYPAGKKDKSYTVETTVTDIYPWGGFMGSLYMEELILPEGLEFLGEIGDCKNLKSITVPSTVTEICNNTFYKLGERCPRLVYLENRSAIPVDLSMPGYVWTNEQDEYIVMLNQGKAYHHVIVRMVEMPESENLKVGGTLQLPSSYWYHDPHTVWYYDPETSKIEDLVFQSSNPDVVKIDSEGIATAVAPGTATVTVSGKYEQKNTEYAIPTGTATCTITVTAETSNNIETAEVTGIRNMDYTGKVLFQKNLVVKMEGKKLESGTDYEVSYKNNKNIGTASITIEGKGNYTGLVIRKFKIQVSKGGTYTVENMKYKITNANTKGKGTVALVGTTKKKTDKKFINLTVGNTVKIGGKNFKITEISNKAFKGYTKLKKIIIGKNVSIIGKESFYGCEGIASVSLGEGMKKISEKAFCDCKSLKSLTIKSRQLKIVGRYAIKNIHTKAKIKVPFSKMKDYKKLLTSKTGFVSKTMKIIK